MYAMCIPIKLPSWAVAILRLYSYPEMIQPVRDDPHVKRKLRAIL